MFLKRTIYQIRYPKLFTLLCCIISAYILFQLDFFDYLISLLNSRGYFSVLLAGFLFAYGFTAPFSVAIFATLAPEINIYIGAIIAGFGALLADIVIFSFIRTSFKDEFEKLKVTRIFLHLKEFFDNNLNSQFQKYLNWTLAGFFIASPLPDEFGISFLSGFTEINPKIFAIISFALNTIGIFILLLIFQI